jgi:two-component system nitrate/nitrite sensor histidine kinase NarX
MDDRKFIQRIEWLFSGKIQVVKERLSKIKTAVTSRWFPWLLVGLILLLALLHEFLPPQWVRDLSGAEQAFFWALALMILLVGYLFVQRLLDLRSQREGLAKSLLDTERQVAQADDRLEAFIRLSRDFGQASDENEVIQPVLRLVVELVGARGASFVPLDEHGQPQTALNHGELPFPIMEAWIDYLATPGVRDRCRSCEFKGESVKPDNCPLLKGPFSDSIALLCLPVKRGEREFGVMTLFLTTGENLNDKSHSFLLALVDEMALGVEGIRLRRREQDALRQMQTLRQRMELSALLSSLLENVHDTLEADFAMLVIPQKGRDHSNASLTRGEIPEQALPAMEGILQGVVASGESLALHESSGSRGSSFGLKSVLAVPLVTPERLVLGGVLVGNRSGESFNARQLDLLQTVAGQVALVIQNAGQLDELEYNVTMQERNRLAREIHDGLAQTIGFLKLQTVQLRGYLARGETDRARQSAEVFYSSLSEAYLDARQAIDNLRLSPAECGLAGWIGQTVEEFQEISGLPVDMKQVDAQAELPHEIHAQLIRILQEALSNVRKHSRAHQVWVVCQESGNDLVLEVRDDGEGFSPEDISSPSRHGLRGMRERADLIGADFQIISRPQLGTTVRVRLPLKGLGELIV